MVNCRAKWSGIWDARVLLQHIWGSVDLKVIKVICGSFDALVSKWHVIQKQLALEQNGMQCGTRGGGGREV